MIRSAREIASEIVQSDAGEFLPSHCDKLPSGENAGSDKDYAFSALIHDNESIVFSFCSPWLNPLLYQ
jgi:hypothetical protein